MASELIIKISAESKDFSKAVDDIKGKTEKLEGQLQTVAAVSGIMFTGLIASAGVALKAFGDSEKATLELTQALQNQGIASNELLAQYQDLAAEIQKKTGIDDDAIVKGEAILQNFLGQTEVSKELGFALADLSQKTGSVESAAEILGRGIEGNTRGLKQFGITIDESLTREERLEAITEKVNQKFGGLAAASNQGLGGLRGLQSALSDVFEDIGARLAPAVSSLISIMTRFFQTLHENQPLVDFVVEIGKIAAIVTGVVTAVAAGGLAVIQLQKAFAIAEAAVTAFGLSTKVAVGATGLGLLLIIGAEIYAHWGTIFPVMQAAYGTFVDNISRISGALGNILSGAVTFNPAKIKAGIDEARAIIAQGFENIKSAIPQEDIVGKAVVQSPEKIAAAKEANDKIVENERLKGEQISAEEEVLLLKLSDASQARIDLKNQEIETLKMLQDEKYIADSEELTLHLEEIQNKEIEQEAVDMERATAFQQEVLAGNAAFQSMSSQQQTLFLQGRQQQLQQSLLTEKTARDAFAAETLKTQIANNNQFLMEQQRFGTAYATINKIMNDSRVQGAANSFSELSKLQQSSSSELKTIGKVAAVADITYKTAQSAMSIYAGFATIPFVGPALGAIGAAAAVAFGAEQIGKVVSAQAGGIVPGFNSGGDSVPSMLQPGELVVPRSSFSEVVNAVANSNASESAQGSSGVAVGGASQSQVMIEIAFVGDDAEKFLTARQVEARSLGTLREANAS